MERTAPIVLATALARVDRRALPEAWYAALHLAHEAPPAPHARRTSDAVMTAPARNARALRRERTTAATGATAPRIAGGSASATATRAAVPERRLTAGTLARKLEHGIARAAARRTPSAFTISLAEGRVRVLVRESAGRTSVVAVCAPMLRERVERALAHARFALAARGVRTEAA